MRNLLIGSLLATLATQAPAQGSGQHIATVAVSQSQLTDGQPDKPLQRRIAAAVEKVCGAYSDVTNVEQFAANARCRRAARADVDRQLERIGGRVDVAARNR